MTLAEKAAYLKGLIDGIKLDTEKDENRLLKAVVDLLQDMAVSIDDLEDNAIAVSDECTFCLHDKYWSHRYTKGQRGSQAAGIML